MLWVNRRVQVGWVTKDKGGIDARTIALQLRAAEPGGEIGGKEATRDWKGMEDAGYRWQE